MIELVQGEALTISDWEIGVYASKEWLRQRAMAILMDGEGAIADISSTISKLEGSTSIADKREKLEILYAHEYITRLLNQVDPLILETDFEKPKSSSNPYGKILGLIPHPKGWLSAVPRGNSVIQQGGINYYNPLTGWNISGKSISRCYRFYREFKESDAKIWRQLEKEVRAGWNQPWRNIRRENKESVAQHTESGILLILKYKEDIKKELGCDWLEIARLLTMFRIHDYPESYSGDIADSNTSISLEEKARRSLEAAEYTFSKFGKDGEHLFGLWKEIEYSLSQTGKIGKEIDKVHAAKQSLLYETEGGNSFVEIYSGILKKNQVTFRTTQKMMIDLGMQYIGFLEGTNNSEKIEQFKPILNSVFDLTTTISSKSGRTSTTPVTR